ncbi:MAG TPA: hypothetical protein VFY14_04425, partial [Streptomyces sp.]|nr:hypothetical protein [Streptomyces sp.]
MDRKTSALPAVADLPSPAVVVRDNDRVGGGNSETIVASTTDRIGTAAEKLASLDSTACDGGRNVSRGTLGAPPRPVGSGSAPPQDGPAFAGGHEPTGRTPLCTARGGLTYRHFSFLDSYGPSGHDADSHGPDAARECGAPDTRSGGSRAVRAVAGEV